MATPVTYSLEIWDGVNTIDLTAPPYHILDPGGYVPQEPAEGRPDVTESVQVLIDEPIASARLKLQAIRRALQQAARFQRLPLGNPVYARYKLHAGDDQYRTEILYGRVELDRRTMDLHWRNDKLVFTLDWRRQPWWEGPEDEIALKNGNGDGTGGRTIENHDDGDAGDDAYLEIDGDEIAGDLPAPVRLEITNSEAGTPRGYTYYVSHALLPDPDNLDFILEAEDGAAGTAEGGNSGGSYARHALLTSETAAYTWALTTAQLNAYGGNWYLALARFRAAVPSSTKLRLQLKYQSTMFWQQDAQVIPNTTDRLQALGSLQLPPAILGANYGDLGLVLTATRASAADLDLDFIALLPLDGLRIYRSKIPYGLAQNEVLVDDSISRPARVYVNVAGEKVPAYALAQHGVPPIMVWPGAEQRLIILHDAADGTAAINLTSSVRAYYRPRRLSL
jgi:hypothetical protein